MSRNNREVDVDIAFTAFDVGAYPLIVKTCDHGRIEQVDLANKAGDKQVFRLFVDFTRRTVLLDFAVAHDHDTVGHRQRFFLIVGNEHEGDTELTLQRLQFVLHLFTQLVVKRRERFVEQQQAWLIDYRTGDGDALLLAAGELVWLALGKLFQLYHPQGVVHAWRDFARRRFLHTQAKRDVIENGHMRKQRVALKYGINVAIFGRNAGDILVFQVDLPCVNAFKPGDQA